MVYLAVPIPGILLAMKAQSRGEHVCVAGLAWQFGGSVKDMKYRFRRDFPLRPEQGIPAASFERFDEFGFTFCPTVASASGGRDRI